MKELFTLLCLCLVCTGQLSAQRSSLQAKIQDSDGALVPYANAALYSNADSSLQKVEITDDEGAFRFAEVEEGDYYLKITYVGNSDLNVPDISLRENQNLDLGTLQMLPSAVELAEATVTATRPIVEIKPDRTVFNVQGTINSVGSDAISLLRKAPGVTVDNNDNINVLGRSGVLLYVDGKRLPLTGQELTDYLQSLPAEQIDKIDIITNPGARYEAEGNAGIIDIYLKKSDNIGANGTLGTTYSQGRYARANTTASGNFRNKWVNVYGNGGIGYGKNFFLGEFRTYQNSLRLDETIDNISEWTNYNYRVGADFFVAKNHTIGFIAGGNWMNGDRDAYNRITISPQDNEDVLDSVLVAPTIADDSRDQQTFNVNYRFANEAGRILSIDLDYGSYRNESERLQPNRYFDASEEILLSEKVYAFDTPTDIDIYTFKLDFEEKLWGGTLGVGSKLSRVVSKNTFLFYDVEDGEQDLNERKSNYFEYVENVYAGYLSYNRPLGEKWHFSAGLRAEQTDANGDLQAFLPELQEPPVDLNYLSWFPNAGLTWQMSEMHNLSFNYGRRINRPDYNVLNPFNYQNSEISFQKGNPFLKPEIVNNLELGYTLNSMYNFKLAYSRTADQITRLIGPDEDDPRANFITWDNLASQKVINFTASAPVQVTKGWNAYLNASASYTDNQADYGDDAIVDVQVFSYSIYQQHTIDLPAGIKGEISGYFNGPGVWGGVFRYGVTWSLDLGLQKKFLNEQLTVRLSASDLFYESGWHGTSSFDGVESTGGGNWDSRRVGLSLSYNFGNQNIKSRSRKTGLEEEAGRVGSGE